MAAWQKLVTVLRNPGSLGERAMNAGVWATGGHMLGQAIRLASNLVMTRLLTPDAFGLMAIVLTLHAGLMMVTDIGIRMNIIRGDHGEDPGFLRTAWTLQALRGALLSVILVLAGAALGLLQGRVDLGNTVYGDAHLPGLIAVSSLVVLLRGVESTRFALAERRMQLARVVRIELLNQVFAIAVMIGVALVWPSPWALVCGLLAGTLFRTLCSHLLLPGPTMRPCWDAGHRAEIWRFGKWLIGSSMFGFIANQGDRLVLASLLGKDAFGLYVIAMLWVTAAGEAISKLTSRVGFAAIGEVRRTRPQDFARVFARFQHLYGLACVMAAAGLCLLGGVLIDLLYTPHYHPAGAMATVLGLSLYFYRYRSYAQLLLNTGDSKGYFINIVIQAMGMSLLPALAFQFGGLQASVLAVAMNGMLMVPWLFWRSRHLLRPRYLREAGFVLLVLDAALLRMAFAG